MKNVFLIIICISIFNSCTDDRPLLQSIVEKSFSSPNTSDQFILTVTGSSILAGEMNFIILNSDGEEILHEQYPANYLIGYELTQSASIEEQERIIRNRVNNFFNSDNFTAPAISWDEEFDEDYSNKADWFDIKSDSTAIGFYYHIGEERGCQISFSKKENKVIFYYCCC